MPKQNSFIASLGLKIPLIVAPMAGGPSSAELVAASSGAGALGSIGGAYSNADALAAAIKAVRAQTLRPFAVNLFIPAPSPPPSAEALARAVAATEKFRVALSLPTPALNPPFAEDFDRQFEVVLREKPAVFSFVFGVLDEKYLSELKRANIYSIGTATNAEEARALEASGVDAVVAQGLEAGGHRGMFRQEDPDSGLNTLDLLREVKAKCSIPVIAAGGIMNAKQIDAMLRAGAAAVQMGTAFLATNEAGTSDPYREKLLESSIRKTKLTRAFSGRIARGIVNSFMLDLDARPEDILRFPAQNSFTRDIRTASAKQGSADGLSLWAGMGEGELFTGSAVALIAQLFPVSG